jgi:hypothetical protein
MAIAASRLDGQNVGLRLTGGTTVVDVLTVNLTTGVSTSPYLSGVDLAVIGVAARLLFSLVPTSERSNVTLLTRLVTVAPADDATLTLTAVAGIGTITLRATTGASPANLVLHVPHSTGGLVAWGVGYASGGAPPPPPATDYRFFSADCLVTDAVGDMVRISGVAVAGVPQVTKCDPADNTKVPAVGIITAKAGGTSCTVQRVASVDLSATAITLIPGARVWVGYTGQPTTTIPAASASPSGYVMLQPLGVATDTQTFELQISQSLLRSDA